MADQVSTPVSLISPTAFAPSVMPEPDQTAAQIARAVPVFTPIIIGNLQIEYCVMPDKILFHIYHVRRKQLRDEAIELIAEKKDDIHIQQVAHLLESRLREPENEWWPLFANILEGEFASFFHVESFPRNICYVDEADSWSVVCPKPPIMTAYSPAAMSKLAYLLAVACGEAK